jgi:hypothetical protein
MSAMRGAENRDGTAFRQLELWARRRICKMLGRTILWGRRIVTGLGRTQTRACLAGRAEPSREYCASNEGVSFGPPPLLRVNCFRRPEMQRYIIGFLGRYAIIFVLTRPGIVTLFCSKDIRCLRPARFVRAEAFQPMPPLDQSAEIMIVLEPGPFRPPASGTVPAP